MAVTSWHVGVQDTPGPGGTQVPLANHSFVDPSFIGASDGSPDAPYKTLFEALDNELAFPTPKTFVLAAGRYTEFDYDNLIAASSTFLANSPGVIFDNSGNGDDPTFGIVSVLQGAANDNRDCIWVGMQFLNCKGNRENGFYTLCDFEIEGNDFELRSRQLTQDLTYNYCTFTNGSMFLRACTQGMVFNNCTFHGITGITDDTTSFGKTATFEFTNCDFNSGFAIQFEDDSIDHTNSFINHCNWRGTQQNLDIPANLIPETNNIDQDPLHSTDPDKRQFFIDETSPLIGAGLNKTIIGAFQLGGLVDFSGGVFNDLIIAGSIQFDGDNTVGNALPLWKIFDQIRKSPIVSYNGFLDGDIVPDSVEDNLRPEKYIASINYRETVGGGDQNGLFLYGQPMYKDNSGRTTGEDDFDVFDISSTGDMINNPDNRTSSNLIDIAEIQPFLECVRKRRRGLLFNDTTHYGEYDEGALITTPDKLTIVGFISPYEEITGASQQPLIFLLNDGTGVFIRVYYTRINATRISIVFQGESILSAQVDYNPGDRIMFIANQTKSTGSFQVIAASSIDGIVTNATTAFVPGSNTRPNFDIIRIGRNAGAAPGVRQVVHQISVIEDNILSVSDAIEMFQGGRLSRWLEKNVPEANFISRWEWDQPDGIDVLPDLSGNSRDLDLFNFGATVYQDY